jgi:hypothetical protein
MIQFMTTKHTYSRLALAAASAIGLHAGLPRAAGQGCIPIRSFGAAALPHLAGLDHGQPWQASFGYRYLEADRYFQGTQELSDMPGMAPGQQVINTVHSFDLGISYTFHRRFSVSVNLPIQHGERTSREEHLGMDRLDLPQYTTRATGIGDLRFVGDYWLFNPERNPHGNVALGLGIKLPTGSHDETDDFVRPDGVVSQPVDQAIQPGDGGVGIIMQLQGFQRIVNRLDFYANGFYLANPREENGTARVPVVMGGAVMPTDPDRKNSVPDQYLVRGGLSYSVWPEAGLAMSLGGRFEGSPSSDLIGGDEGFRRPGYTVSIEPGLNWMYKQHSLAVTAPVALERNRQRSETDRQLNRAMYPGSFADWTLIASYSFRF